MKLKYAFNRFVAIALLAIASTFSGLATSAALTDFAENKIIDAALRAQAIGAPATWYVSLYTVCPTDSTGGTEATGGSYARVSVTAGLSAWAGTHGAGTTVASTGTGGTTSNNAIWTFATPSATWGTVVCWGVTDASTAGHPPRAPGGSQHGNDHTRA